MFKLQKRGGESKMKIATKNVLASFLGVLLLGGVFVSISTKPALAEYSANDNANYSDDSGKCDFMDNSNSNDAFGGMSQLQSFLERFLHIDLMELNMNNDHSSYTNNHMGSSSDSSKNRDGSYRSQNNEKLNSHDMSSDWSRGESVSDNEW